MLGAMQGMMHIDSGTIVSGKSMLVVLCFTIGIIVGELIGIENGFEKFGEWLKKKTGNSGDKQFDEACVLYDQAPILKLSYSMSLRILILIRLWICALSMIWANALQAIFLHSSRLILTGKLKILF
jgi:hypothetical protein